MKQLAGFAVALAMMTFGSAAFGASDSYICWLEGEGVSGYSQVGMVGGVASSFLTVGLHAGAGALSQRQAMGAVGANASTEAMPFLVELCGEENGALAGDGSPLTYSDLLASGAIASQLNGGEGLGLGVTLGLAEGVPEPTSALLLVLGLAALQLKRRKLA